MLRSINKKADMGKTLTWIVATVIIFAILGITIAIASLVGKAKIISEPSHSTDFLASQSLFSYLLTKDANGKTVYSQLQAEENLNDFNGNLGVNIFKVSYKKEYNDVWLGLDQIDNDFFGVWAGLLEGERSLNAVQESIKLGQDKNLQLVLVG